MLSCRQFFDPKRYRIVLLDQRGCGASKPHGCLIDNNTQSLVGDMEALRVHLGLKAWMLFAGSWGVTLALAYSIQHPERCALYSVKQNHVRNTARVTDAPATYRHTSARLTRSEPALTWGACCRVLGIVLRGVCLMRRHEIDWVFRGGCKALFPAAWMAFVSGLSTEEAQDPLRAYYARLTSDDPDVRQSASKRMFLLQAALSLPSGDQVQVWEGSKWDRHELATWAPIAALPHATRAQAAKAPGKETFPAYSLPPNEAFPGFPEGGGVTSAQQLLTAHYSMRDGFLTPEDVLQNIDRIRGIPAIAVQGRNDMVCPVTTAYDLHLAWPELELQVVTAAGHSMYDANIAHALLKATTRMDRLIRDRKKQAKLGQAV